MSETARETAQRVVNKLLDEYSSPEEFSQRPGGRNDPLRQTTVPVHFPSGSFSGKRPGEMLAGEDMPGAECCGCGAPCGPGEELCPNCAANPPAPQHLPHQPHHNRMSWRPPGPGMGESKGLTKPGEGSQPSKAWHQGKLSSKTSSSGAHSAMGNPAKAWHQGKIPHKTSATGATSAVGTPGKAWKKGKAAGGEMVAPKPGKLSYKEALMRRVLENIKVKKAMKMGKANQGKMCASKPGKVSYKSEAMTAMKGAKGKKNVPTVAKAPGKVKFGK